MSKSNGTEEWRRHADTHKMSPEEVRAAGVEASKRPPGQGHGPGEVLHQRRRVPYSVGAMAVGGFLVVAAIGYFVLYYKSRPGTSAADVAKATLSHDDPGAVHDAEKRRNVVRGGK